jgi:spermidine synthase
MVRHSGRLLARYHDEWGQIEVIEEGGERSLYFGSEHRQSTLYPHAPTALALSYTRAMLASLLFVPDPARILLVGLGGGSLVRFLRHYLPDSELDIVELRPCVIDAARHWFDIDAGERLTITCGEGGEFMRQSAAERYDILLIDAYSANGMAPEVSSSDFFAACHATMRASAVLALNLWQGESELMHATLDNLKEHFDTSVQQLRMSGKDNLVVLAQRDGKLDSHDAQLSDRARHWQRRSGLNLGEWLQQMRQQQPRRWLHWLRR